MKTFAAFVAVVIALSTVPMVPSGIAQGEGDFEAKDTRGDVSPFGFTPLGMPSSAATDAADMTGLRIFGEDIEGLSIELAVANLKPSPEAMRFLSGGQFSVDFMLEGSDIQYTLNFYVFNDARFDPVAGTPPTGTSRIPANFYLCVPTSGCYDQRILASVDWDKSLITGYLPKGALAGREPVYSDEVPTGVPAIRAGSRLASIQARAYGNLGFSDFLPDSGVAGPYVLKSGVPNERIGLSLVHFDGGGYDYNGFTFGPVSNYPAATVTPGTPSLVQVRVSNFNQAKRIINLTSQLVDTEDAGKWSVRVVNTLTIPGGDHRIINLIVNATQGVEHRDEALVRINARSIGFPDEIGNLRVRLVAAVPPTPEKNTLFLHMSDPYAGGLGGLSFCIGCGGGYIWMNTLEEDPQATDATGMTMGYNFFGLTGTTYSFDAILDTQLTRDLVLDLTKNVKATIVTTCSPCPTGSMTLELRSDVGPIASGTATYATTVEVELVPVVDRVPLGSYVGLFGTIQTTSPPPVVEAMHPRIIGGKSQVQLPVIKDPDARPAQRIPLGPAFLTLSAENATGQFVAPGKSRVVAVTVVNEGIEEDVVTIEPKHEADSWKISLQPGEKFRLKPGESATFGVVVRAPVNASEGETIRILLNATSDVDESALAQLQLELTASENALDEESEFEVDEDTEKALEDQPKKSPGPGLFVLVGVAALAFALRRRLQ